MKNPLGQMLLHDGLITQDQLDQALQLQKQSGLRMGSCLIDMGLVGADQVAEVIARQLKARAIKESQIAIDPELIARIPAEVALDYELLPMRAEGDTLEVVIGEPRNYFGLDDLRLRTGFKNVIVYVAPQILIRNLLWKHYRKVRGSTRTILEKDEA